MSAYIVSDDLIVLLSVYAAGKEKGSSFRAHRSAYALGVCPQNSKSVAQQFAELLMAENVRSVNYRYNKSGGPEAPKITTKQLDHLLDHVGLAEIATACECYEYQSCETDDYFDSAAAHLIAEIRKSLLRGLKGFDVAAWGFEYPESFTRPSVINLSRLVGAAK